MKIRKHHIIILFVIIFVIVFLKLGIKIPPDRIDSKELSNVKTVSVNMNDPIEWSNKEINYWETLKFDKALNGSPGSTPDFVITLKTENNDFTAMYNENSELVYFSFVPEVEYGFLNKPSPGGWTEPLYKVKANDKLLKLLKIR